mgnify:FL=1
MSILKSFDLSGKLALVTGASRGIGKGIAVALASAGADVVGVSASLPQTGSDIENEIKKIGRDFKGYKVDFSKRDKLLDFVEDLKNQKIVPDILINNAGTIRRNSAENHPTEWWDEVIEVNLSSQFLLSREIGREMINKGSGKIIFIASLLTFQGGITVPGYAASKGGIGQLTKALANEWASKGINVNAIAPGYIATDNTEAIRNDKDRYKAILERIPQGRWGAPDDFAGPSVFLASEASNYVNGEILTVDGGWMGR